MDRPQRVCAIHDLSGFGRCSLSVIMPVISAMGIQVCPVPTAVLSTHTGGLGEVAMCDLTDFLATTLEHYKQLKLEFECIYSGFLGSEAQIDHCLDYFKTFSSALKVVDPVMGDHGKSYRTVTPEMQKRMTELVAVADVITPNMTEVSILLNEKFDPEPMTREQAKTRLLKLSQLGPDKVVITGVPLATGERLANVGYDRKQSAFWCVPCEYLPVSYPGTGDLFASVLTGSLLLGDSLPMAISRAAKFAELSIKTTYGYGGDPRFGVMLEGILEQLTHREVLSNYQSL